MSSFIIKYKNIKNISTVIISILFIFIPLSCISPFILDIFGDNMKLSLDNSSHTITLDYMRILSGTHGRQAEFNERFADFRQLYASNMIDRKLFSI